MTDRLREGIGRLLGEEWPSADVLDMLALNGDPCAAEVAAKCGVRADDEPPPEQRDQRSTRDLAVADSPIIDRVFAHEVDIAGPDEPKTAPTADEAAARLQ